MITTRAPDGANKSCSKLSTFDPNLQLISIVQYQEDDLVAYMHDIFYMLFYTSNIARKYV